MIQRAIFSSEHVAHINHVAGKQKKKSRIELDRETAFSRNRCRRRIFIQTCVRNDHAFYIASKPVEQRLGVFRISLRNWIFPDDRHCGN